MELRSWHRVMCNHIPKPELQEFIILDIINIEHGQKGQYVSSSLELWFNGSVIK